MGTKFKGAYNSTIAIRQHLMQRHNVFMRKSLQNVRLAQRRDGEALALGGVVRLDALQGPRVPRVFFRRGKYLTINALADGFLVVVARADVSQLPRFASVFQGAHLVVMASGSAGGERRARGGCLLQPALWLQATALAGPILLAGQQVINWIVLLAVAHKQRLYRQRFTGAWTGAGFSLVCLTRR